MNIDRAREENQQEQTSAFFALIARTQLIERWSLMRNIAPENVQEHSFQVALIAQALVFIQKAYFPKDAFDLDPDRVMARALFHDVAEVMTGDLPTPVKYYSSEMREAYKKIEHDAAERMLQLLPDKLQPFYRPYILDESEDDTEGEMTRLIKLADKLSALIKCNVEESLGNTEFIAAKAQIRDQIASFDSKEANFFIEHFMPSFSQNIDQYHL